MGKLGKVSSVEITKHFSQDSDGDNKIYSDVVIIFMRVHIKILGQLFKSIRKVAETILLNWTIFSLP